MPGFQFHNRDETHLKVKSGKKQGKPVSQCPGLDGPQNTIVSPVLKQGELTEA